MDALATAAERVRRRRGTGLRARWRYPPRRMPTAATVAVVVTRNAPVRSSREPTSPATVARSIAPPAYRNACPFTRCSAATARWRAAASGAETRAAARCDLGASHPSMTTPSRTPSAPNPNPTTTKSTARPPAWWPHAAAAALPGAAIRLCRAFYGATHQGCSLPGHIKEGPSRRMSPHHVGSSDSGPESLPRPTRSRAGAGDSISGGAARGMRPRRQPR
jgi:hypothetical protein